MTQIVDRIRAELIDIQNNQRDKSILSLFDDVDRFQDYSADCDLTGFDYSRTSICQHSKAKLIELARASGLEQKRTALFAGETVNFTENRAAMHMALRAGVSRLFNVSGKTVNREVCAVLERMTVFCNNIRDGKRVGSTGRKITDIVNIGIGGSDLGPLMACEALVTFHTGPNCHFVSNIDGAHLTDTLRQLNADTTLFIVASKTFTTVETMTNARSARAWLTERLGKTAVAKHFVAISTNHEAIGAFGIKDDAIFGFWDWVGGRYSIWSAIGLSLMLAIGPEHFNAFLAGAANVDRHFESESLENNVPVLMALVGIWHRNICNYSSQAIIPYEQRLHKLPAYLQQLDMESNGKSINSDGDSSGFSTSPLVWGEPGTNGQHAFFQFLHQGTDIVPVDFLLASKGIDTIRAHHDLLVANCLAQMDVLMTGRSAEELETNTEKHLIVHKVCKGNRPSCLLYYEKLDPATLGNIIALYEHKIFVQGVIWGINSFDQMGVELGKERASSLLPVIQGKITAPQRLTGILAAFGQLNKDPNFGI
ncbi:MAG: glucose-6-phosphate isomerase [Cohaesibacteraceae bacterium]|nr:glucose-6-phosphate isomerase [Cohaesibacteraceae bacterium]